MGLIVGLVVCLVVSLALGSVVGVVTGALLGPIARFSAGSENCPQNSSFLEDGGILRLGGTLSLGSGGLISGKHSQKDKGQYQQE